MQEWVGLESPLHMLFESLDEDTGIKGREVNLMTARQYRMRQVHGLDIVFPD